MADTFTYLMCVVCLCLILYLRNYFRAVYVALRLKGPETVPILGNVLILNDSKRLEEIGTIGPQIYGPIILGWLLMIPVFFITEPQHVQTVIGTNKYSKKNFFYRLLHNFLGEGLITSGTAKNKKNRRLIQPLFHINILETFINVFAERSLELLNSFSSHNDINITKPINMCIYKILQETVLGISGENEDAASPFRNGEALMNKRLTRPWLLLDSLFKFTTSARKELEQKSKMKDYARKIVRKHKEKLKHDDSCSGIKSLMDMFIEISEDNEEFTEEDIINESCTFMLAGQDSTGAATVFTLYFLAKHSEIQNKVREELQSIFGNDERAPDLNDLNEMRYLEQCIKEALRLCPSVPLLSRTLIQDVDLGKYTLPSGSRVVVSPFITQRLPNVYPDPLKYDPERFSSENLQRLHPYAFIPFSGGPRNCLGQKYAVLEIKTIISTIVRNYYFELSPGHEELELAFRVTIRARGGVWLRFKKIKQNDVEISTNKLR